MPLLAQSLLPLVLLTAIVLLVGLLPLRQRTRKAAIAAELGAHATSWIIVLAYAAIWMPRSAKVFQDFGIEVSSLSVPVIKFADLMAQPWALLIVSGIVLAADGIIYSLLWTDGVPQATRNRFSLFMTLVPLSIMLAFGITIYLLLVRLTV